MATTFAGGVAAGVSRALAPLETGLQNEAGFQALLLRFGWDASVSPSSMSAIRGAFKLATLFQTVRALVAQLDAGTSDEVEIAKQLVTAVGQLLDAIRALTGVVPTGLPFPLDQPAFWSEVPPALVDELLCDFLEDSRPTLYGTVAACGLITLERATPDGIGRVPYVRRVIHWDALPTIVADPVKAVAETYRWKNSAQPFNHAHLIWVLELLLDAAGLPARRSAPVPALTTRYYSETNPALPSIRELDVPLFISGNDDWSSFSEVGLLLLPIPPEGQPGNPPAGVLLAPLVTGTPGNVTGVDTSLTLTIEGGFEAAAAFHAKIFPTGVALEAPTKIDASATLSGRPPTPYVLAGASGSHRFEVGSFNAGLRVQGPTEPEIIVEVANGREATAPPFALVLDPTDGDGLVQQLLGREPQRIEFDARLAWSSKTGLTFSGDVGIHMVIPLHVALPNVRIEQAVVAVVAAPGGARAYVGITATLELGPVSAAVEEAGISLSLVPVPAGKPRGVFGDFDLDYAFKLPRGVALSIDSGAIVGGGYLFADHANSRYAGAIHLEFSGMSVNAIGLLTTTDDDFSLLVLVSASGFAPIQLGLGFALTGVGGLLGINRGVDVEALRGGMRTGSLKPVLFSQDDLTPRSSEILATLESVFPRVPGSHVFGPMVRITWGTPKLLDIDVALILQLPAPLRLIVLGRISAALPDENKPIIELKLDVLGVVDFDRREVAVDATLHDSRLASFALTGEMALRASWGANPSFALAVGGFHPAFAAPPGFPKLRRLTFELASTGKQRLRLESYLAVTSNTVQFGSRLDFALVVESLSVEAVFGFDTLITLAPFGFSADVLALVALKWNGAAFAGATLAINLAGPNPWRVRGTTTLEFGVAKVTLPFEREFGTRQPIDQPETVDVWALLKPELEKPLNWSAKLPSAGSGVVLAPAATTGQTPLAHPRGELTVSQRVVPLDREISHFGSGVPKQERYFRIAVSADGGSAADVQDYFAPAQFFEMREEEKLAAPSFERLPAGSRWATAGHALGAAQQVEIGYATYVVGADGPPTSSTLPAAFLAPLAETGPAALAASRSTGRAKYETNGLAIAVADTEYVVADDTLAEVVGVAVTNGSYTRAAEELRRHRAAHREVDVQIVTRQEAWPPA